MDMKTVLLGLLATSVVLAGAAAWGARGILRLFAAGGGASFGTKERKRLLDYPLQMFWTALFAGAASALFALSAGAEEALLLFGICLLAGMVVFGIAERLTVRYAERLARLDRGREPFSTFLKPLTIAFLSLLLLPVVSLLWFVAYEQAAGREPRLSILLTLAGAGFMLGVLGFLIIGLRFRRAFRTMISGISVMLEGNRELLRSKMPVRTSDEIGQLGHAFNELQTYITQKYVGLEQELALAYSVQHRLLPEGYREIGVFGIAAACKQTKEVGGDLYDIMDLGEGRMAVIVGDVTGKGMPAALLMTATLALFRREARSGASAADVLSALNRMIAPAVQKKLFITLGLAIFDESRNTVEYASAGHMPPYVVTKGELREVSVSSMPLGIFAEAKYRNQYIPFPGGSRLILYTDGIVEGHGEDGEMLGFEQFEPYLLQSFAAEGIEGQLDVLMNRFAQAGGGRYPDDRAAVIIERMR
jgi:serine phosphatase RsbU (regulator of sigma subunit)